MLFKALIDIYRGDRTEHVHELYVEMKNSLIGNDWY